MPVHISDLTQSNEQILVDMINFDNGLTLTVADVMFDPPETVVDVIANTRIVVHGINPAKTHGLSELFYIRRVISELPGHDRCSVYIKDMVTIDEVIPTINAILGINLSPGDYVEGPLPDLAGAAKGSYTTFNLMIVEDNPIYLGQLEVMVYV